MNEFKQTETNQVRRQAGRGKYDRETIYSILDEGYLCHVGFSVETRPFVIPTLYARAGDSVFIHGSSISRMLKKIDQGVEVCITVTLVDGIVLARSAFHHSMNYRSAVVFGNGTLVTDRDSKIEALRSISENVLPERWADSRQPTENELNVTSVIEVVIREASAKIRTGDPSDDEKDYELPIWAGVLPLANGFGKPVPDSRLAEGIDLPDYLTTI
jgi:nitroimidazol reductase NimA-like FMN-containing flavoprotein (pyridoxamine 5'-phosphate oxidase superfamily)